MLNIPKFSGWFRRENIVKPWNDQEARALQKYCIRGNTVIVIIIWNWVVECILKIWIVENKILLENKQKFCYISSLQESIKLIFPKFIILHWFINWAVTINLCRTFLVSSISKNLQTNTTKNAWMTLKKVEFVQW